MIGKPVSDLLKVTNGLSLRIRKSILPVWDSNPKLTHTLINYVLDERSNPFSYDVNITETGLFTIYIMTATVFISSWGDEFI